MPRVNNERNVMTRGHILVLGVAAVVALVAALGAPATPAGRNGLIVYAQELRPEHYQLFTIRPDGSGTRQITHLVNVANPDWSPTGKSIVAEVESEGGAGITLLSSTGTVLRNLTPKGFQGQPSFSPDGNWIVYERDIAPGNNGVWLMRSNGTDLRRVTRNPFGAGECGCDTDPNFSPDGKLITFVRIKKDESQQALFAVRPNGTGLRQLTPYSWNVAVKHDWSPDGKLIVLTTNADYLRPNESANLVTIRPDGSGKTNLTGFKGRTQNAFAGSFSPDGEETVFRIESGDTYSLAVIDRDGGNLRRLTTGKGRPRYIDWGTHP
jgi:Tol biopolymer transport system component